MLIEQRDGFKYCVHGIYQCFPLHSVSLWVISAEVVV